MLDIVKDETFTTFVRAHERKKNAPAPWAGYTVTIEQVWERWAVVARHPYLERAVLIGNRWFAIPNGRGLIQGTICAWTRMNWFYETGEILE